MEEEYWTIQKAAQFLDVKVCTLYKWSWQRRLRSYKLGSKALRFRRSDLEKLLQEQPALSDSTW